MPAPPLNNYYNVSRDKTSTYINSSILYVWVLQPVCRVMGGERVIQWAAFLGSITWRYSWSHMTHTKYLMIVLWVYERNLHGRQVTQWKSPVNSFGGYTFNTQILSNDNSRLFSNSYRSAVGVSPYVVWWNTAVWKKMSNIYQSFQKKKVVE